jgi:hypothetical protein
VAPGGQHRDRGHGLLWRVVAGQARTLETLARLGYGLAAQPRADHARGLRLQQRRQRVGDACAGHDGGGRVCEEQHAGLAVGQQCGQRGQVARLGSVADQVHRVAVRPVRGQRRVQGCARGVGQRRQRQACGCCGVGRHHAGAAAVGDDGEAVRHDAGRAAGQAVQRERGVEELLQRVHAQHAGAAHGGVEHGVRARERARVRGRRRLPLGRTPGLHQDDRLVARRRARGRHELARRGDRFHVEQDGARLGVVGQPVEHVAEIDVGALAQRDEVREAHAAPARPVEQGRHQRAGLRHECQLPRLRAHVGEAGVQADVRRQQAQAVGPEDAQQVRARRVQHGLFHGRFEAGGQHHGGPRAARAQGRDQRGHRGRRRADHGELGRLGQRSHVGVAGLLAQHVVLRVHGPKGARVAAGAQVAPDGAADAASARGGAEDGHRSRVEKGVEMADAHAPMMPRAPDVCASALLISLKPCARLRSIITSGGFDMKMLIAVDGSEGSLQAVRHALTLASEGLAASFVLANVQEPASLYEVVTAHDPDVIREVRGAAGADLLAPAEALLATAGVSFESEVTGGDPANLIVEMAENYGCDAIVLGGAGSVATAVLAGTSLPVTLVRMPEAE